MDRAGIETMLMNYYRHIDRTQIQFDFLVNKPKPGDYDDEIRRMGGRIYLSPGLNPIHYPKYLRFVGEILKNDPEIRILHAHNEAMGLYALNGAKHAQLPVRIAHAHNTCIVRDYKYPLKLFCKQFLTASATQLWSCGTDAGEYFFGKAQWRSRGMIMRNAIETQKFRFSPKARHALRAQLGVENKTVIGHVGRFNVQKNHARLLDIFSEYAKLQPNAVLLLIGGGELEAQMQQKVRALGLQERVIFAGLRSNVHQWYMAMDAFVMPSLFEGLPVVGIEAQCAGLPCIFSDAVTEEVVLSHGAVRVSLQQSDGAWARAIADALRADNDRADGVQAVIDGGYDIETEAGRVEELYLKLGQR